MDVEAEKVYVAIGNDLREGLATLEWALRKWSSHSISIVLLHISIDIYRYVYTYYGKLPANCVNDEKLKLLREHEKVKMNKTLQHCISFCGKVKAEVRSIEKCDEPIHKQIVELLTSLRVTKLVMGITFIKFSTWKCKNPLNFLRHIQSQKPDFCELFTVCSGRLVFLKEENNEGFLVDDLGDTVAATNKRPTFKLWLGKMFPENGGKRKSPRSSPSSPSCSHDQWEKCTEEIENYFNQLSGLKVDEEADEVANGQNGPTDHGISYNLNPKERTELLKIKIGEAREEIHSKRREAKEDAERHSKAEWAITVCSLRAEEMEARLKEETTHRENLERTLTATLEELQEIQNDVGQKKTKLDSLLELQRELVNKIKSSSSAKLRCEAQLEKIVSKRASMVQEIEKLRTQRDVMQRRIEFCREKDAIGTVMKLNELRFGFKEFTADEIRSGTDNFSESCRLKSAGLLTNVYKGQIAHTMVAVKLYDLLAEEDLRAKVKLLSRVHNPHLVEVLGFCAELKCIVFEYMHKGSLKDALTRKNRGLHWHDRIRIVAQVFSGLGFLHLAQPRPIAHGSLSTSKILLDKHNTAKILGFFLNESHETDIGLDIHAFGGIVMQILTGRNWTGLVEEAMLSCRQAQYPPEVLDGRAGDWPLDVAMELAGIGIRCLTDYDKDFRIGSVMREIEEMRKKSDEIAAAREGSFRPGGDVLDEEEITALVPNAFLCPIYQDVMGNPTVAADGISYELKAIETWLGTGHDTSPVTNLRLTHKELTPNHTLRSFIQEWHDKRSIPLSVNPAASL